MAPYTKLPDDVKKLAGDARAAITSGQPHPFKCPIIGQDDKPIAYKGGDHLDDGQSFGMNFYANGISDKLPGK